MSTEARSTPDIAHDQIAQLAYSIYAERGFIPGHAEEDWLEAESRLQAQHSEKPAPATEASHSEFAANGVAEHLDGLSKRPVRQREHPGARDERGSASREEIRRMTGRVVAPRSGS